MKQVGFKNRSLKSGKEKPAFFRLLVGFFKRSNTSCANVAVRFLAVFHVGNLLNVYFESSSRFTVGVTYVVAGRLTFTANITYSRHIDTSDLGLFRRS